MIELQYFIMKNQNNVNNGLDRNIDNLSVFGLKYDKPVDVDHLF